MSQEKQVQVDVWETWGWLWNLVFYATVLLSLVMTLIDEQLASQAGITLGLTVGLLIWHSTGLYLAYQHLDSWDRHVTPRLIVIVGDIVFWFILVNLSLAYYFLLFGLFIALFRHLPIRFASATAIMLTILVIVEQVSTDETFALSNPNNWLFLLMGLASIFVGIWISAIIGQSTRRRELIDQLEAAQSELAAAERREGILQERQRLAHEIHDTLAQGFTSIVMHLEAAEQALPDDLDILQKHLNQARTTARHSLDQARRVVQDLRPEVLEQRSLPDAIQRVVTRWQDETGISASTTTTGDTVDLQPHIEVMLLRGTQEALNNIRKHAQATHVRVTLSYMGDVIMLDIQDDGVGLGNAQPSDLSGGYGLQAMRERAEGCGGTLMLESDPDEGTTVVITVPLLSNKT